MSALCQKQTFCAAANNAAIVGEGKINVGDTSMWSLADMETL
jgi:hypothetical protein